MPLIAFTGHPFLAEETLHATLAARGLRASELPRFGGEEVTPTNLGPHLAPSLFGDGGVIVDLAGVRPDKALLDLLLSAPVTVAVLDEAPPATRLKAYEKGGEVIASPAPSKAGEVTAWVIARAKQRRLGLGRDAAAYLAEVFGSDLAGLAGELHKLELLAQPGPTKPGQNQPGQHQPSQALSREDVQRLVGREPPGDSFAMLDAATAGRPKPALEQLRRLLASGEDPFKLLGAVVWQYGLIARCVALLQEEGRVGEAAAAARLGAKPYSVRKALDVARRLDERRMRGHLLRIQGADLALKRGGEPGAVLERLLIELSL